ncbi:MAG: outer membrane beta-barrel protein [Bacteroidaceae bacterium]|nr:outer membrane beta-barrel protein [Bacteroidaceae bacterium]
MKKFTILSALLLLMSVAVSAQTKGNLTVKGSLFDFGSAEALYPANVQVLALPDSTYITGASTEENGSFSITGLSAGSYVIRCSFIGYVTTEKTINLKSNSRNTDLGRITMKADAQMLKEVAVTAAVAKVQMVNDTVVYNGAAFKLPEGSTLEELVRRLPGVQIGSDGDIKVNGKSVSRILVNGKEFFNNDKSVAMQNLTADMVDKIKAYEKQSDMARMTGIDDGNEETVLDLTVKKGMAQGWFGNFSVGYGQPMEDSEFDINNLYNVNANMNRFNEDQQFTMLGSYGNARGGGIGGFGGMRGMGGFGVGSGVNTNGQLGANFALNIGKEVTSDSYEHEIGGSINYSNGDSESMSKGNSESAYHIGAIDQTIYNTNFSRNENRNNNINAQIRYERNFDKYTSLIFTPSVTYSNSKSKGMSLRNEFSKDPFDYLDSPWDIKGDEFPEGVLSYMQTQNSKGNNYSVGTNGSFQLVHRLNDANRNFSFNANYSYQRSASEQRQRDDQNPPRQGFFNQTNTYNDSPHNDNFSISGQVSYTEPLNKTTFLSATYQYSYSKNNTDQLTYDFMQLLENMDTVAWAGYKDWGKDNNWVLYDPDWEDFVRDHFTQYADYHELLSDYKSQNSEYINMNQTIQVQLRKTADKYNFNLGISILPQHSIMTGKQMGKDVEEDRTVFNWTPTVRFIYRWTRQEQLQFNYSGRSNQPTMNQLVAVRDDTSPRNIREGNPGLDPTFRNNFSLNYRRYNPSSMFSFNVGGQFQNTLRNITNVETRFEDDPTVSFSRPENMDDFFANWSSSLNLSLNFAFGDQRFTISSDSRGSYGQTKGLVGSAKNLEEFDLGHFTQTKRQSDNVGANEQLDFSFRSEWVELSMRGSLSYNHSSSNVDYGTNRDTYDYSYGPTAQIIFPWHNLRFITDCMMSSRRGYGGEADKDELLWNAQMSVSFLRGNAATFSIAVYDILQERSNVSRNVSAFSRTTTYSNNINSYFMATLSYRLSMFGDRDTRRSMRGARGGMGGFGGGMGGFGGGMGGFGGGMGGMGGGMGMGGMF